MITSIINSFFCPTEKKNNDRHDSIHYVYLAIRPVLKLISDPATYTNLMMQAIAYNNPLAIRTCYYRGADLNTTKCHRYGCTPLMFAIECGQSSDKALQMLLRLNADCNKQSNSRDKVTALFLACREKGDCMFSRSCIKRLLDAGADPNMAIKGGVTPLMEVCYQGNEAAMKILLEYGADPNRIDYKKKTALDLCTNEQMRKILISVKTQVSTIRRVRDERGAQDGNFRDEPRICVLGEELKFTDWSPQPDHIGRRWTLGFEAQSSGEVGFEFMQEIHPKINNSHIFKSGFLLPDQALVALNSYTGNTKKLKKL